LQLFECIESLKNDVKRKMTYKACSTFALKSPQSRRVMKSSSITAGGLHLNAMNTSENALLFSGVARAFIASDVRDRSLDLRVHQ